MEYQKIRPYMLATLVFIGFLIYQAWVMDYTKQESVVNNKESQSISQQKTDKDLLDIASIADKNIQKSALESQSSEITIPESRLVKINTKNFKLQIDLLGGDIVQLDLPLYPKSLNSEEGFELFDHTRELYHIAQSGIYGENGPDKKSSKALYSVTDKTFNVQSDGVLNVDLKYTTDTGVLITKRFKFDSERYDIGVDYIIENKGSKPYSGKFYSRLKNKLIESKNGFLGMNTFKGLALNTPDKLIKKISYKDAKKEAFSVEQTGGWAAIVDHYFLSAWIPSSEFKYEYIAKHDNDIYSVTLVNKEPFTVLPNQTKVVSSKLYAGPELADDLSKLANGLEKTVDYGIFWPICKPIFWLLDKLHSLLGNWGLAIIFTTLIIKGLFFNLSASSYKSMGRMRKIQPKINALKERCGDDKQRFGQEMMSLYKKEKINPLGGCLPILVQIPVFIALYYVLLNSVELRQAPFAFWIQDLSVKDPFYVLPLLMGASMLLQQRLNPAPPDPVQAKVMMAMPFVFTVLFLQFPSGLVLYWVVNNVLSISQQYVITKRIEKKG